MFPLRKSKKKIELDILFSSEGYEQKDVYYIYYLGPVNKASLFQKTQALALCVSLYCTLHAR